MPYFDFTDMPVYMLANEIVTEVYKITTTLPRSEDYALCSQLRRAAISITGNIAEGFGRAHTKEKANFYFIARGSCFEVRSHLLSGINVGYFPRDQVMSIYHICLRVTEELNKMVLSLKSRPQS